MSSKKSAMKFLAITVILAGVVGEINSEFDHEDLSGTNKASWNERANNRALARIENQIKGVQEEQKEMMEAMIFEIRERIKMANYKKSHGYGLLAPTEQQKWIKEIREYGKSMKSFGYSWNKTEQQKLIKEVVELNNKTIIVEQKKKIKEVVELNNKTIIVEQKKKDSQTGLGVIQKIISALQAFLEDEKKAYEKKQEEWNGTTIQK